MINKKGKIFSEFEFQFLFFFSFEMSLWSFFILNKVKRTCCSGPCRKAAVRTLRNSCGKGSVHVCQGLRHRGFGGGGGRGEQCKIIAVVLGGKRNSTTLGSVSARQGVICRTCPLGLGLTKAKTGRRKRGRVSACKHTHTNTPTHARKRKTSCITAPDLTYLNSWISFGVKKDLKP